MKVEIITIGDEILSGDIFDTNSRLISQKLFELGFRVTHHSSVCDDESDIFNALNLAKTRADLVFVSGGLGPTSDDFTLEVASRFFGVQQFFHDATLKKLEEHAQKRSRVLSEANKKQAYLPQGCEVLDNDVGTAPGVKYVYQNVVYYFLPGVPRELESIFIKRIVPSLMSSKPTTSVFKSLVLKSFGATESEIETKLKEVFENRVYIQGVRVAFRVAFPEVYLKLSYRDADEASVEKKLRLVKNVIEEKLGTCIYTEDQNQELEHLAVQHLMRHKKTLALAESCTGGFIAHRLTNVSGSSSILQSSFVTYANESKQNSLGVSIDILNQHGAVSEECAEAMVKGLKQKTQSDVCVAVTGIAGPTGGDAQKPVGTVWIAFLVGETLAVKKYFLPFERLDFKRYVSSLILNQLRQWQF